MIRRGASRREDPYRLMKYIAVGTIEGILAGWALVAILIAVDLMGLRSLAVSAADGQLALLMLFLFTGITFSMAGIAFRVMVLLPGEED